MLKFDFESEETVADVLNTLTEKQKTVVYALIGFEAIPKARKMLEIERVIFHEPATVVYWSDGSKTVVKANNESFDPEKGLVMAIVKRMFGNKGNYYNFLKKWLPNKEQRDLETASKNAIKAFSDLAQTFAKHCPQSEDESNLEVEQYYLFRELMRKGREING